MINYPKIVEDDLKARFTTKFQEEAEDGSRYTVNKYYGSPNLEMLAEFVANKLTAGIPAVMVGSDDLVFGTPVDTMQTRFEGRLDITVIVACNIVKDKEFEQFDRFVDKMVEEVLDSLADHVVELDGDRHRYIPVTVSNLFRVEHMDAKRIQYSLQPIDINLKN